MLSFLLRLLLSSILVVVYVDADMFACTGKCLIFFLSLAFAGTQTFVSCCYLHLLDIKPKVSCKSSA